MTVHGNFSELTFVNSTTPAINATNLNAIESTLKIVDTELARSLTFSWEFYKEMIYNCGQKTINRFINYTDWNGTGGPTISEAGHSSVLIHGRGVKMLQPTNDAEELAIYTDVLTQKNLAKFESNDTASSADLICILCYISDITYITRITIRLGVDTSNYYYYDNSVGLVNGWNMICIPKSSFSTYGTISDWTAIDYVAYRALFAANGINQYVIWNHCALVRADGTTATLMNPFVANDYSDNWDNPIMTPSSQFLVYKDVQLDEICLLSCMVTGIAAASPDFLGSGLICSSFSATFRVITRNTSNTQGIMWYVDDDNWLLFHIDDADVTVTVRYGGSLSYYYTALASDALTLGSTLVVRLEKIGGSTVRMFLTDESGNNEFIEVSGESLSFLDTTEGEVGIGSYSTNQKSSIQDFVVSNRRLDDIKLLQKNVNNNELFQYVIKEDDEIRTSTTTVSDDDDFNVRLAPYGVYKVTARFNFSASTSTPDFKCKWAISTDITALTYKSMIGPDTGTSNAASTSCRTSAFSIDSETNYGCDGTNISQAYEEFIVSTGNTGGILKLQWSQNTSSIASTTLHEESFMVVQKIADNF